MVTQQPRIQGGDEDGTGLSVQTPPRGAETIEPAPGGTGTRPIRRDVVVDEPALDLFHELLGDADVSCRVVPLDLSAAASPGPVARSTAVVIAIRHEDSAASLAMIEKLRAASPQVGIYVVARSPGDVGRLMAPLAAAGVDEVFCTELKTDRDMFAETLGLRLDAPAPETEIRLLWKWFRESDERSLVMHCVRNGFRLDDFSIRGRMFDACRKTLQNRVATMGLPSPGLLARCGRVYHAQELERRGVEPASLVAELIGFPTAGALQRARRRLRKSLLARGRHALVFASLLK
jgi:hypothetical protein